MRVACIFFGKIDGDSFEYKQAPSADLIFFNFGGGFNGRHLSQH